MAMNDWKDFEDALRSGADLESLLGLEKDTSCHMKDNTQTFPEAEVYKEVTESFDLKKSLSVTFASGTVLSFMFPRKCWSGDISDPSNKNDLSCCEVICKPLVPLSLIAEPSLCLKK